MSSIFENAKFGDKFKMRNGNPALYVRSYMSGDTLTHYLVQEQLKASILQCYDDGQNCMNHKEWNEILFPEYVQYDIVEKWEESIDEKKLVHDAHNYYNSQEPTYEFQNYRLGMDDIIDAYKAGYRKAKEN